MKNARRIVLALSAAAALSLAACSSPAPQPAGGSGAADSQSQAPAQDAVAFKKYSEAELTALLENVKGADGKALTVLPSADLKKGLELTKSMAASTKVTPAECATSNVTGGLQAVAGATAAAATSAPNAAGVPVQTVSVVSGLSEEQLKGDLEKNSAQAEKCKNVTVEVMGQKVEASVEKVDVPAATPGAIGLKTTTKSAAGDSTQVIVVAVKGGVALSSLYMSSGDVDAEAKQAAATLDEVAALIK